MKRKNPAPKLKGKKINARKISLNVYPKQYYVLSVDT